MRTLLTTALLTLAVATAAAQDARYVAPVDGDTVYIELDGDWSACASRASTRPKRRGARFAPVRAAAFVLESIAQALQRRNGSS
ncbi:MAG: hypothetical protein AAF580_15480 [Pseudomonadota bacterium]